MALQNSINAPTPFAIAKGGTGNTTALTNGQLWIGDTGNPPSVSTLTEGSGVTITNAAGAITIAVDLTADVLPNATSAVPLVGNTTYITTNISGGITTFTLPLTPVAGEFYEIIGGGSQGWTVAQRTSQQIFVNSVSTTPGTDGSISSTTTGGSANENIIIWCQSSTVFIGIPSNGNVSIV